MEIVLLSGLSGAGKSIALHVLEDAGCYCVDNLPAPLLTDLVAHMRVEGHERIAVAVDMRGGTSIASLPAQLNLLADEGISVRFIFLDARDDVLIQRFSETRRAHPLVDADTTLAEAISREREALESLASLGHHIDTSHLHPSALRQCIREFVEGAHTRGLTLLFESFGFKHGLPLDADLVFDVRCLPNPYYDVSLRALTGRDASVVGFLEAQADVLKMREDIARFVGDWLPNFVRDNRAYLTVAIGCTGGQHRSVYLAEQLATLLGARFSGQVQVLVRHRSLVGQG
jgi:RNase adapter protein RapZ